MICLTDNDIVFKLAACDLLNEALTALRLSRDEVFVLNTIKYQLREARSVTKLAAKYGSEGLERALEFVLAVREIEIEPDLDELALLSSVEGIDAGEAVLFAVTKKLDGSVVATGDKKALTALRNEPSCDAIYRRLCRRILCFEKIISVILHTHDLDSIKPRIVGALSCDTVLQVSFGSSMDTTLSVAITALEFYTNELRATTGDLLLL